MTPSFFTLSCHESATGNAFDGVVTPSGHDVTRLHRKTLCYSKSVEMLNLSVRLVVYYLKHKTVPLPSCIIP
jgi:hypothetical protein